MTESNNDSSLDTTCDNDFVVITGMSGAGRTEAIHTFEDLGYYCIDNLPGDMLEPLLELRDSISDSSRLSKLAVVCDARSGEFLSKLETLLRDLRKKGVAFNLIFLDADDEKLVARYKSSRRRHPLCDDGMTIGQGIQRERSVMFGLREAANSVIDTTELLPPQLHARIRELFSDTPERAGLAVTVYSFGFKHGAANDADIVIDVRFLPNPYYDPQMRYLTGLDASVRDFVMYRSETEEFMRKWEDLLDCVMPGYVSEGKQQLAIAVGCTGGQHRSVAIAESTGNYLKKKGYRVSIAHRDLSLAQKKPSDAGVLNA